MFGFQALMGSVRHATYILRSKILLKSIQKRTDTFFHPSALLLGLLSCGHYRIYSLSWDIDAALPYLLMAQVGIQKKGPVRFQPRDLFCVDVIFSETSCWRCPLCGLHDSSNILGHYLLIATGFFGKGSFCN